jgi:hypothetical protein
MMCVHHIPGRMRLRSAALKGNLSLANRVKQQIATFDGVERAEANSLTGSILIHYRGGVIDGERLMARIGAAGWADSALPSIVPTRIAYTTDRSAQAHHVQRLLATLVLQAVTQLAIERSISALAAAIF